ncbi:nitrogen regulatory protein P-II family /ammonium transporter [Clostridium sp. USBA 49]|uniref:ammonium transporter n=1 Tax=Clostridium sp. USBA 49 TaxID=1881060 RepID=UPI00099AB64E|nr:ammonium transporter [Clostridium sp. USBA 49]SKA88972.1 nitrogen regulatory protein P-II family /ammonium transporter [Clostridium sp. USBA 49]
MYSSLNTIWVLLATALVFFMQAGFAMVESGLTRAKNAGNIIMKNLLDFAIGTLIYWLFGFGIMFAGNSAFIGGIDFLSRGAYSNILPEGVPKYAFFIFQTVFCATSATIVSGAMAERTKFISYCIYSALISAIVYPISGHWIWGGGWLSQLGFHDFAGSTAVHMVGGIAALIGAKTIGPRIGKYDKNGNPKAILGHNLTLTALGVFILWFCWFGFNGGSTVSAEGDNVLSSMGNIFFTTNLSAAVSTITAMIITWIRYKKPDVSMTLNGSLAGLVAITAGTDLVTPVGAFFIGIMAGFLVVYGIEFIDRVLKIDDPVGAIGVHGLCGAFGTLMVGLFSANEYSYAGGTMPKGLLYGGGFKLLGIQLLGVVSVIIWVSVTMIIIFFLINKTVGLRASNEDEINGLDISEHGLESAYADFISSDYSNINNYLTDIQDKEDYKKEVVSIDKALPIQVMTSNNNTISDVKFTKIEIITKQSKFEELKSAMDKIGITGMTVTNVLGYGIQGGRTEYYRGVEVDTHLLPKIKVEVVVTKVPVKKVIDVAKKVLYTGNIGDGKIFIYNVENVIKVRTGEEGYEALQDVE